MTRAAGSGPVGGLGDAPAPGRTRIAIRRLSALVPVAAVFLAVLVLWEVVLTVLGVQVFLLPRPTVIAAALVDQWTNLGGATRYTATEALGGLAIGSLLGVGVAFATLRWTLARESLLPVAIAANSMPIIAFAPITNNWFGSDSPFSRMAIVAVMVFFPMMVNTVRGLTYVDASALELMRSYAASDWQILRSLRIPNALPYVFTALKIATTLSVIGAVVGEYFGGPRNALGIYITAEAYLFRYPNAWAAIVLACALGIGFYMVVVLFERLFLPWHSSFRQESA
jgi:NitT/TauT family transport system permease protein